MDKECKCTYLICPHVLGQDEAEQSQRHTPHASKRTKPQTSGQVTQVPRRSGGSTHTHTTQLPTYAEWANRVSRRDILNSAGSPKACRTSTTYRAQGTGHRAQGTGHRAQGTGHRAQGTGYRAQGTGHRAQGTGHRQPFDRIQYNASSSRIEQVQYIIITHGTSTVQRMGAQAREQMQGNTPPPACMPFPA